MRIKHKDLDIPETEPFKFCQLDRSQYAAVLTEVVRTYSDGFVLSLNNQWGTGKTTFIKMWNVYLQTKEFKTIYFNAWENDFDNNPLVALMAELETLTKGDDSTFKALTQKAAVIGKNILPALIKAITAKYIDPGVFSDVLTSATEGATEILDEEIKAYSEKKKGLIEFRTELEKYVKENIEGKPLVLIIDELDRCRPNYAVQLLEQIKHFFNVPGIVFVLSIDKEQLGNAVKGVYGSEQLNSDEYLRRFIDIEFVLPDPEKGKFTKYLYNYYEFGKYFTAEERKKYRRDGNDSESLLEFAILLFDNVKINLRQQEKVFAHARIALNSFGHNQRLFPILFIFLIFVRDFQPKFYKRLVDRKDSPQTIINELKAILPANLLSERPRAFQFLEALLVLFYNNYYQEIEYSSKIMDRNEDGKNILLIEPIFDPSPDRGNFISILEHYNHFNGGEIKLSYFLNKVSLMSNFIVNMTDDTP